MGMGDLAKSLSWQKNFFKGKTQPDVCCTMPNSLENYNKSVHTAKNHLKTEHISYKIPILKALHFLRGYAIDGHSNFHTMEQ